MNITTRNLHLHTAQQVFDFVCTKVIEQGRPSLSRLGSCTYRGDDDCKCAIGHLILDEDYPAVCSSDCITPANPNGEVGGLLSFSPQAFEGLGWRAREQDEDEHLLHAHGLLLFNLQVGHDKADANDFIESFKRAAVTVARDFNLDPTVVS